MSIETWLKEFFPTEPNTFMTDLEACNHAIRKFEGTLPENLKKHEVRLHEKLIFAEDSKSGKYFKFSAENCGFCLKYIKKYINKLSCEENCKNCPLKVLLGKTCDDGQDSPWVVFINKNDGKPMLELLRKVKNMLEEKSCFQL